MMKLKHRKRRDPQAGVTLIEMMVVLVIIAVVAAIIVPNVIGRPDEARLTVARSSLKTLSAALELYRLDNGRYPTTEQGLQALADKPTKAPVPARWAAGGYVASLSPDPWGQPFQYNLAQDGQSFELLSYGADGMAGGSGNDADILAD